MYHLATGFFAESDSCNMKMPVALFALRIVEYHHQHQDACITMHSVDTELSQDQVPDLQSSEYKPNDHISQSEAVEFLSAKQAQSSG